MSQALEELTPQELARADALHRESLVIDACTMRSVVEPGFIHKMTQAGVNVCVATAYTGATRAEGYPSYLAMKDMDYILEKIDAQADRLLVVREGGDIRRAQREGKIAIILYFQNGDAIGDDLSFLRLFYRLGVRCLQLTYNDRNLLGDGCAEPPGGGLSHFGAEVIREMNRLGMVLDLSHVGDKTVLDAIAASEDPVTLSHCNVRAMCENARNKTEEQMQALARKGGVIGVNAWAKYVTQDGKGTARDLVDHIDWIKNHVGIDHVGLGLDLVESWIDCNDPLWEKQKAFMAQRPDIFGEDFGYVLRSVLAVPGITREMVRRRYTDEEIGKVLGLNFLRVYEQVLG